MHHRQMLHSHNTGSLDRSSNPLLIRFKTNGENKYRGTNGLGNSVSQKRRCTIPGEEDAIRNQEQLLLALGRRFTTRCDVIRVRSLSRNREGGVLFTSSKQ